VTGWADYLVVTQKPSAAMLEAVESSGLPVLDVAGALAVKKRGFRAPAPV
jgi:hypothetical protein